MEKVFQLLVGHLGKWSLNILLSAHCGELNRAWLCDKLNKSEMFCGADPLLK